MGHRRKKRTCDNEILFSPMTGEKYSACSGDYWNQPDNFQFKDSEGNPMQLVKTTVNELGNQEIAKVIKKTARKKDLADIV